MAYSDCFFEKTLNSQGNEFTNIRENKVFANISELTVLLHEINSCDSF